MVGLGSADPSALFADHRDAGRLSLLPSGTATNTVNGAPAAPVGGDPETWWELLRTTPSETARQVSAALTGDADLLGPLAGGDAPHQLWARAMVTTLWPALWGHALKHVAALGGAVDAAAGWAAQCLFPEGPFPTLRLGSQPYGLLPVSALREWKANADDPEVEQAAIPALLTLRRVWATAAEAAGTTEGADAERLLDVIAQAPHSPGYAHRLAWPLETWHLGLLLTGHDVSWADVDRQWHARNPLAGELRLRPERRYGARGASRRLQLPLVAPTALPPDRTVADVLLACRDVALGAPASLQLVSEFEVAVAGRLSETWQRPVDLPLDSLLLRLAVRALQVAVGDVGAALHVSASPGLEPLATTLPYTELQNRISAVTPADLGDPGPEAAVLRRVTDGLKTLAEIPAHMLERLLVTTVDCACYRIDPWVNAPAQRRLGQLLGPGREASQLRLGAYGWVDGPAPGSPGPTAGGLLHAPSETQAMTAVVLRDRALSDPEGRWHMDITSRRVRRAKRLAEEVRLGAHLSEVLGREVERAVGSRNEVERLRASFPIKAEHAGRRVCDGLAVISAAPASLGLPQATVDDIADLRAVLDVYADLLVAEAVHHVVEGRGAVAGAAMDAAAGLAKPPEFDVIRTQREGRTVGTSCVVVLDHVAPPATHDDEARAELSPAQLADAAAAAAIETLVGDAGDWTWGVTSGGGRSTVTLAQLGLHPADALSLPLPRLEAIVAGDGDAKLTERDGSRRYEVAVRLVSVLGRTPALGADTAEREDAAARDEVEVELRARLEALLESARALDERLQNGLSEAERWLAAARRWGIAPEAEPDAAEPIESRLFRARELLLARLAAVPGPSLSRLDLVRAIVELVSPTGQLAVLARLPRAALPPSLEASDLAPGKGLDTQWLPIAAAVRPAVARLEAHQLAAGTAMGVAAPFTPWANRRDPWQTVEGDARRLVAAYAPAGLDLAGISPDRLLAVGLVDRWSETIPATSHTTTAAFGFDAPAARAPQAILLAVPPAVERPLVPATLVSIVAETRELARARMAVPDDLEAAAALVPTALLPAVGPTAVSLETAPPR